MKRMEKTSVLLYCHCAAGVIGLAKSCLLATNSWEKNRHYFYYYWSRRSTADPAVQYDSISCWERPTARPNNYKGDQNPPLGPLQRPFKGQKPLHSVFKTFKINFDLVNFSPKSSLLWLLEVRFEFGHWDAEQRKDWRIFVTFTKHPKLLRNLWWKLFRSRIVRLLVTLALMRIRNDEGRGDFCVTKVMSAVTLFWHLV